MESALPKFSFPGIEWIMVSATLMLDLARARSSGVIVWRSFFSCSYAFTDSNESTWLIAFPSVSETSTWINTLELGDESVFWNSNNWPLT